MPVLALLLGCPDDGTGANYPAADLVRFDGASLAAGEYDPREGDVVVEAATEDGHDWSLALADGVVVAGVAAAGEVRSYRLDGSDDAGGIVLAEGGVIEGFGAAVAARPGLVVVGVPNASGGTDVAGAGAVTVLGDPGGERVGAVSQGRYGSTVAACGDLDGDGADDVAAGAPWEASLAGAVYVGAAGDSGDTSDLARLVGESANERFGGALACADLVGESGEDLVVGAPFAAGATTTLGEGSVTVWDSAGLVTGKPRATLVAPIGVLGSADREVSFGASVAVCRFHADGRADLVVGAPTAEAGAGAAFVYFGGEALADAAVATVSFRGDATEGRFGATVACGDVDGDGLDELFVGAPGVNAADGTAEAGAVYGFAGVGASAGAFSPASAGWTFFADRAFLRTGAAFVVGDLDGDALAEVVLLERQRSRTAQAE